MIFLQKKQKEKQEWLLRLVIEMTHIKLCLLIKLMRNMKQIRIKIRGKFMKNYLKVIPDRYKQLNKEEKLPFIIVMLICFILGMFIGLYSLINFLIH